MEGNTETNNSATHEDNEEDDENEYLENQNPWDQSIFDSMDLEMVRSVSEAHYTSGKNSLM